MSTFWPVGRHVTYIWIFTWKFVIGIKFCPFVNLKWHLTVHFGDKVCQTDPELTVIHLLVSFASKHQSPRKQQLVQLKTQNHKHVSMRQLSSFEMQHKCFMDTSYFVTWNLKKMYTKDFPGSPEVKTSCFQSREWGFHRCLRNQDPMCCVAWQKKKKKKYTKQRNMYTKRSRFNRFNSFYCFIWFILEWNWPFNKWSLYCSKEYND